MCRVGLHSKHEIFDKRFKIHSWLSKLNIQRIDHDLQHQNCLESKHVSWMSLTCGYIGWKTDSSRGIIRCFAMTKHQNLLNFDLHMFLRNLNHSQLCGFPGSMSYFAQLVLSIFAPT